MAKNKAFYDLQYFLAAGPESELRTCPVCYLVQRSIARYLDGLLYESVNDPGVRKAIRQARGFCNRHAWQLRENGNALGIAIIYRDVMEAWMVSVQQCQETQSVSLPRLQKILRVGQPVTANADLAAFLEPQEECPACRQEHVMEDLYLTTLLQHLDDEGLAPALRASAGLCLPHFRRALQLTPDENTLQGLLEVQMICLKRLHDDLDEFIRKHDYRFQGEGFGVEGDSWIRAIVLVSGEKGVR